MKKPKSLRTRMVGAIFFSLLLLWAVMMLILHSSTENRIQIEIDERLDSTERQVLERCQSIIAGDMPEGDKRALLEYYLSSSADALNKWDSAAVVMRLYDAQGNETARTQLAWGMADAPEGEQTDSSSMSYHLSMDRALRDDHALLAYINWILTHRVRANGYELYPSDASVSPGDGTVAMVTGVVEHNHIEVQRITLHRPDGTEEVILEAGAGEFDGETLATLRLSRLTLESSLAPILWHSGDGRVWSEKLDLKALLAHYRFAETKLDAFYKQNGAPTNMSSSGGYVIYAGNRIGSSVAMGFYYDRGYLAHRELLPTYFFTLLVALGLGWFLSKYLSRKLTRSLEELSEAVGKGHSCCDRSPIAEVNLLAAAFNAAQGKMANDLKREQDLTRAVAHELKTPLAILRSHAEALQEDIDPAKRERYLAIIMDESDHMAALVGELLDLSRMEAGAEKLNREAVDLKALTERVFAHLQNLARVTLNLEPLSVSGDPRLLERAVSNYASNALRHVREGGEIRVALRREGENALLTVENDGDPIPPESLSHLWDTFYKADSARTRGQGTGLGLAIVKSIATLHGGTCGVENRPGAVAFTLSLSCTPTNSVV